MGELLALSVGGLILGLSGALLLSRAISILLFGVSWDDGLTLCLAMCVMLVVVTSAACIPAQRAALIDPMQVLRSE